MSTRQAHRRRGIAAALPCALLAALALLAAILAPASASAAQPQLWKSCETGSGAEQCSIPRGIGVDPGLPGHLYVSDQGNYRIVELTAWGEFVKAWGWGVADGSAEPQVCTAETGCQKGLEGPGAGQLNGAQGLATDSAGAVYVVDRNNRRIQKFSPEGEFLWMAGGEVNKTTTANLCTKADLEGGDECGAGVEGVEPGFFGAWPVFSFIAIDGKGTAEDADDVVYVGDVNRIQKFDTGGVHVGEIALPEAGSVGSLAADPASGDLYFTYAFSRGEVSGGKAPRPFVYRLDAETAEVSCTLGVGIPAAIATDPEGGVYAFDQQAPFAQEGGNRVQRVLKFDDECNFAEVVAQNAGQFVSDVFSGGDLIFRFFVTGIAAGSACLSEGADVYVANNGATDGNSFVRAFGPPPDDPACPPKPAAPDIDAQYALSVGTASATLEALINPHFWSGSQGETRYYVQYATVACVGPEPEAADWKEPCVEEHPAPPGSALGGGVVNEAVPVQTTLTGLEPATAYRYRFAAESIEGATEEPTVSDQPVFGVGGSPGEPGAHTAFITFPEAEPPPGTCPNEALRSGPSAALPDCRAYEMVSPVEKANGEVLVRANLVGDLARANQAAASGRAFTYSTYRAFAEPEGSPWSSQYIARRTAAGWGNESISPPQEGPEIPELVAFDALYRAFTPELTAAWLMSAYEHEPPLGQGGQPGYANLYLRTGSGEYEACTTKAPELIDRKVYVPQLEGISADQKVAVFSANGKLTEEASTATESLGRAIRQLYACSEAGGAPRRLSLVSVLPSRVASDERSTAGTSLEPEQDLYMRAPNVTHALSEDGSLAYWRTGEGSARSLYLRENPGEEQSAMPGGSAQGAGDLIGPALGKGRVLPFSKTINEFHQIEGSFSIGQVVTGECPGGGAAFAAGTKITAVEPEFERIKVDTNPTGNCFEAEIVGLASVEARDLTTSAGEFKAGQSITGQGIPPGATIEAVGTESLTLSAPATETVAGGELESFSECTESEKGCTVPIATGGARFWAASPDGAAAIYSTGGTLFVFDAESAESAPIADGFFGVAGQSTDLSRVYLASTSAEPGGEPVGPNSRGDAPIEGAANLYLYEADEVAFIATLAAADSGTDLSPVAIQRNFHTARVTPDGGHLAFTSAAQPTGYDNRDRVKGLPAAEVYLYDAETEELLCASCNPSGSRPLARTVKRSPSAPRDIGIWAAAHVPIWMNSLYATRALSEDGSRLFFDSIDSLALTDTNGKVDTYQWEAPGSGDCDVDTDTYSQANGGCIDLVSSGQSPTDSEFLDADPSGENVFFTTERSLVPEDPGLVDVYVARVNGGLQPPSPTPPPCEGDACQNAPGAPEAQTPASATFEGAGNVREAPRGRCARSARKARGASRRAKRLRRAARRSKAPRRSRALRRKATKQARRARRHSRSAKRCRRARGSARGRAGR